MFKFSLKQLFRRRSRAVLFFLLLAASTALVLTGSVMTIESAQRIAKVESSYTTIGMVEQLPTGFETLHRESSCEGESTWQSAVYGDPFMMDTLDFPGANYIVKPEQRVYFMSYVPELSYGWGNPLMRHVLEFTPLESTDGMEPVEVEVTRVLYSDTSGRNLNQADGSKDKQMEVGDRFFFSQLYGMNKVPLEAGERYVAEVSISGICKTHGELEYHDNRQPYSDQSGTDGKRITTYDDVFYAGSDSDDPRNERVHHVTEDFYEPGHLGAVYERWAEVNRMCDHLFPALGTSSLETIPSFHDRSCEITEGRAITPEEFQEGAPVCVLSEKTASVNRLSVGDKVKLPMMAASYGGSYIYYYNYPLLNAKGEFYDVFWEQEYEIVGLYSGEKSIGTDVQTDVWSDLFIIPINSVKASWENNIAQWYTVSQLQAGFQIPNGTIEEFDAALREKVPEAADLKITYDDRGYTEVMKSLKNSRDMAFLLLMGGVLAALAIIALLLYFFVVKEKKRTAIERSLGMSKRQCRVSLLSGLMVLTAVSVIAGAVLGTAALGLVREEPASPGAAVEEPAPEELDARYKYSTKFSMWAQGRELAQEADIDGAAPMAVYFLAPALMCLVIVLLSWLLLERSFMTDPIYLLSTRENR